ncbi:molybdopterin-dependent oxidoreductase [Devosia nitrariae]|uniref:Oxidoreductase molybdopterin-binding domain-containing protein n=1 Tax=Devosia nitrariae TaxID=2071872 RepID=A0ABQ5W2Y0_9HYPH|nr:molybdopterin-dependent oxidoreductase [Devosia nitrariae]GLQ54179.1 hypothetical protein GCM10010862_14380 [Devosia nitrariae]
MRSIRLFAPTTAPIATIAAVVIFLLSAAAGALEPVTLPEAGATVAFKAINGDREVPVTVRELEALGLYRVTTTSPWEKGELVFEGVLFSDVVEHVGLGDADAIRLRGLDSYTQVIPREDWIDRPLILATRQNGELLTRRTQGPTRVVYPLSEYPAYDSAVHDGRWVWLIESMDPVE